MEDTRAASAFVTSIRLRNLTPTGTIEGGASSLVASIIAWLNVLFTSKPGNNFLLSSSRTSARSIRTNRDLRHDCEGDLKYDTGSKALRLRELL